MESDAMAAQERKAIDEYEKAKKKESKTSMFGNLFGANTTNKEDAAEMYKNAGVAFKVAKKFDRAGEAFLKSAELHHGLGNKLDELNNFVEAARAFKECKPKDAIDAFAAAAEMCMDQNRMGPAAKHYREIGEIYEGEYEFDKAIAALKSAADFFKMDNQNSNANTCNLKVAAHSAQHGNDYETAIKIFETVGKEAAQNNLLKYSAKKYFFHAGLCRLASGKPVEDSKLHIESYKDFDVSFVKQRECTFLLDACEAMTNGDAEEFTGKITAFDNISQLDPWTTSICLRIKKSINAVDANDLTGNAASGGDGGSAAAAAGGLDDDELC